ncbi:hypothetical protein B1B_13485, partial [mine drainage metagenome]
AALRYYDLIDQNIVRYSVISQRKHRKITVGGRVIEFSTVKRSMFFGYASNGGIHIAEPEKLFVDCVYFGKPGFAALKEALATADESKIVDADKIAEYTARAGSRVLASKLGFLLESVGIGAEKLLPYRYYRYIKIGGTGAEGKSRRWLVHYD